MGEADFHGGWGGEDERWEILGGLFDNPAYVAADTGELYLTVVKCEFGIDEDAFGFGEAGLSGDNIDIIGNTFFKAGAGEFVFAAVEFNCFAGNPYLLIA